RHPEEGFCGVRELRTLAIDDSQLAFELQFRNRNVDKLRSKIFLNRNSREKRDSISHRHKLLDRLNRRQFDVHVQGRLRFAECVDHLETVRRLDIMRDENLSAELLDFDSLLACQWMLAVNDERELVGIDRNRLQIRRIGPE